MVIYTSAAMMATLYAGCLDCMAFVLRICCPKSLYISNIDFFEKEVFNEIRIYHLDRAARFYGLC